ncbi:MAG: 3-methyl-2-oxobutanoate dehydrogenase subunit VorB [candidate division Zixibacteria bacterium]|nr:3-methyl-2-oxobutanoate dehydrogenase subunit VorB [candidate division Zixibacteria bacterium]MDH3937348.1 3-methyl-2-oxobutanoate dehydrogenase subunit VorB [candidate division Zixibacteria bacterium]
MAKVLMKGNEAIAEAALRAGAEGYFCYPITPQTEVAEYLAKRMPEVGGVYLQGESELAVGNMLFGAASTGKRVFTTSSSPGISLMQEAISYMAGAELPAVIINIMRGGPGLGGILPAQADYFQAVKGGGHGDYRTLVLAPSTVQEAVDLTMLAFYLADKYRNPVMLIGDGMIGQMMEAVEFPEDYKEPELPSSSEWAATGAEDRKARILKSLFLDPVGLENNALKLDVKYKQMIREEVRCESYKIDSANQILIIAYGTMARICQTAIDELEEEGISVGLFRPISLYPFPEQQILDAATRPNVKSVLTIEMSTGQMVEDVQKVVQGQKPVEFFGRTGGIVPTPEEVKEQVRRILSAKKSSGNKKA